MDLQVRVGPLLCLFDLGKPLDQILEGQSQLIAVKLLRAFAELEPLQLDKDGLVASIAGLDLGKLSLKPCMLFLQPLQSQLLG